MLGKRYRLASCRLLSLRQALRLFPPTKVFSSNKGPDKLALRQALYFPPLTKVLGPSWQVGFTSGFTSSSYEESGFTSSSDKLDLP